MPVQGSDQKNHLMSGAHSDGVESLSPAPFYFFPVDLENEHTTPLPEHPDSSKSVTESRFSVPDILGECPDKTRQMKSSKKSFRSSLSSSSLSGNSSASVVDGLDRQSDFLISNIAAMDKPVKKSSKRKGKKRGKKYKRSKHKKASVELETQYKQSRCKSSHNTDQGHSVEPVTLDNWSESPTSTVILAEDIAWDKHNARAGSSGDTNSTATLTTVASLSDMLDESESRSSSQIFTDDLTNSQFGIDEASTESTSSSSPTQTLEITSCFDKHVTTSELSENGTCISFDQVNSSILKSPSSRPNRYSENYKCEIPSSSKDDARFHPSKAGMTLDSRDNFMLFDRLNMDSQDVNSELTSEFYDSSPHSLMDVVFSDNSTERTQCSSQACSSDDDFQPVIYRKKGRSNRKMTGSLNVRDKYRCADIHGQPELSRFSVWQNVKRNVASKGIRQLEGAKFVSPHAETSPESPEMRMPHTTLKGLRENRSGKYDSYLVSDAVRTPHMNMLRVPSTGVNSTEVLPKAMDGELIPSAVEKLERKATSQHILHQVTRQQNFGELGSPCNIDFQEKGVVSIDEACCCLSEPQTTPQGVFCDSVCGMSLDTEKDQSNTLLVGSGSLDQRDNEVHSHDSDNKVYEKIKDNKVHADADADDNKHSSCISMLEKESIAKSKDLVLSTLNTKDGEVESLRLNSCRSPSTTGSAAYSCYAKDIDPPLGVDNLTNKLSCSSPAFIEFGTVFDVTNDHSSSKISDSCSSGSETSLDRILHSVHDSYKLQTASEAIHRAIGSPLAEFEKLVYSASPVVCQMSNRSCKICSPYQMFGKSLCKHLIPNISLGSIWQWYEKPGNYGLEVKAEDYHNSRRSHKGCFGFHGYFVPYLSAIQVFGASRNDSNREVITACEKNIPSKNLSDFGSNSVSSALPHPCKEVDPCMLQPSSPCNRSVNSTRLGCDELLFEYFESDQPYQRKPFYEKIKELVGGDKSSNSHRFGDPSQLESLHLLDIHPASWYSVAWYPIYRIPDGDFRAAFLTYHSLGHFVQRSVPSSQSDSVAFMVSPVVGLQSYNAKVECWFRMRDLKSNVAQTKNELSSNISKTFEERLKTLERTASSMARASVRKGNLTSVNRQPDYEFFSSRNL